MYDILRYFAFGQALLVLVLTIMIVIRYSHKLVSVPKEARVLPAHIVCISLSYLGLIGFVILEMRQRLGSVFSYRIPLSIISFTLGDLALIFMLIHLAVHRLLVTSVLQKAKEQAVLELVRQGEQTQSKLNQVTELVEKTAHVAEEIKSTVQNGNS